MSFSNRCFWTKAVAIWRALDDEGHARLVELIRKRSGEEAEELWRKHLAESAKVVLGDRSTATVVELLS